MENIEYFPHIQDTFCWWRSASVSCTKLLVTSGSVENAQCSLLQFWPLSVMLPVDIRLFPWPCLQTPDCLVWLSGSGFGLSFWCSLHVWKASRDWCTERALCTRQIRKCYEFKFKQRRQAVTQRFYWAWWLLDIKVKWKVVVFWM